MLHETSVSWSFAFLSPVFHSFPFGKNSDMRDLSLQIFLTHTRRPARELGVKRSQNQVAYR